MKHSRIQLQIIAQEYGDDHMKLLASDALEAMDCISTLNAAAAKDEAQIIELQDKNTILTKCNDSQFELIEELRATVARQDKVVLELRAEMAKLCPNAKFRVGQYVLPNSHVGAYEITKAEFTPYGMLWRYELAGLAAYGWHGERNLHALTTEQI